MKKIYLYLIIIALFIGCTSKNKLDSELHLLDLTKEYHQKEIDIHEIADVEYVPLETTDESIMEPCVHYSISDKYIVSLKCLGDKVFVFDRKGNFLSKIDAKGLSHQEYSMIATVCVDHDKEECFIYDLMRGIIQVYSFQCQWKRTLKLPGINECYFYEMHNYDENYLIGHNRVKNEQPFCLINKNDGKLTPISLVFTSKLNASDLIKKQKVDGVWIGFATPVDQLVRNGSEFYFSDINSDTIYSFKKDRLTPIAVQNPSVNDSDTPYIIDINFCTEQYISFSPIKFDPILNPNERIIPNLLFDRKNNQIVEWKCYNSEDLGSKSYKIPAGDQNSHEMSNVALRIYAADYLCEQYEAGNLKGKLAEVASKLRFDDNPVLVLCKFQK